MQIGIHKQTSLLSIAISGGSVCLTAEASISEEPALEYCWDLCGGRRVTVVPTATNFSDEVYRQSLETMGKINSGILQYCDDFYGWPGIWRGIDDDLEPVFDSDRHILVKKVQLAWGSAC